MKPFDFFLESRFWPLNVTGDGYCISVNYFCNLFAREDMR